MEKIKQAKQEKANEGVKRIFGGGGHGGLAKVGRDKVMYLSQVSTQSTMIG